MSPENEVLHFNVSFVELETRYATFRCLPLLKNVTFVGDVVNLRLPEIPDHMVKSMKEIHHMVGRLEYRDGALTPDSVVLECVEPKSLTNGGVFLKAVFDAENKTVKMPTCEFIDLFSKGVLPYQRYPDIDAVVFSDMPAPGDHVVPVMNDSIEYIRRVPSIGHIENVPVPPGTGDMPGVEFLDLPHHEGGCLELSDVEHAWRQSIDDGELIEFMNGSGPYEAYTVMFPLEDYVIDDMYRTDAMIKYMKPRIHSMEDLEEQLYGYCGDKDTYQIYTMDNDYIWTVSKHMLCMYIKDRCGL